MLDADRAKVGRAFSAAVIETALASYPGLYALTPPGDASAYGVYWPTTVPAVAGDRARDHQRRACLVRPRSGPAA